MSDMCACMCVCALFILPRARTSALSQGRGRPPSPIPPGTYMVATADGMWMRPASLAATTAFRYPSASLGRSTRVSTSAKSARASAGLVSTTSSCVMGGPLTIMPSASSCSTTSSPSSDSGGGRPSISASARFSARRAAVRCCCTRARCSFKKMASAEFGSGAAPLMRGRGRQGRQSLKQRSQGNCVCGVDVDVRWVLVGRSKGPNGGLRRMVGGRKAHARGFRFCRHLRPQGGRPRRTGAHLAAALGLCECACGVHRRGKPIDHPRPPGHPHTNPPACLGRRRGPPAVPNT